jgi:adenosylcobinamide kinase/adenosylcobinamide-phosphate guanylyltransferase
MGKFVFISGGARSGKSTYAQRLAQAHGEQVLYLATALSLDDEMKTRIQVHRQERPDGWQTLELPYGVADLPETQLAQAEVVLLDCLTMLVTNLMLQVTEDENAPDEAAATARVDAELEALLAAIRTGAAEWIIVTNEVGLGLVPPYPLGRLYRDLLGRANQRLAAAADQVYFMVSGIPLPIHPYRLG